MDFVESLKRTKLLAILRGVEFDELETLSAACRSAGLEFVEITMNTPKAAEKIARLIRLSEGAFRVGAGTVLTCNELHDAARAGASFIVSPVLVEAVAKDASRAALPYLPGALTPQEIYTAHLAGAAVVKVFPAQCFGPGYLRELRGPFPDIPLLACGGMRPDNVATYLESGADAVALGASTFKREWLQTGNVDALTYALRDIVARTRT